MSQGAVSVAFQGDKSVGAYAALARLAEDLGFDGVSAYADLGFQPAIVPLLAMASATTRVRLGPAALNPSLLHPVEIAGQIAALDSVSRGRAYLAWPAVPGSMPSASLMTGRSPGCGRQSW